MFANRLASAVGLPTPASLQDAHLFRDARKIIFEQIQTERLYYPYRVATPIGEFYDTFAGVLADSARDEILNPARYIERRIGGLPLQLQQQRYVIQCLATMARIRSLARLALLVECQLTNHALRFILGSGFT